MAAFKDKKNGSWYVQFRYTDWRGERQQKLKRGFATKKEAQAWEREFLMQKQADVNMSFESFVALYEKDVKPKLKLNTWLSKEHIIRTKILPYFKKRKLSEITARDVIDWQNEIRQHTKSSGEGIHFSYDGKRQVLSGVDFTIPAGKITAVVGENGCGKSTLIGLLERFQHEQSGQLLVDGAPLDDIRLKDWRENVGYLFQGNQIIQGTIRENITYGVHRAFTEEELVDAAKKAKAYNFIQEKENGFDTQISRFDNKYSGGEMQRIAIARMILKRPEILIMDEATSGIDVISEHEVMEALMNLMAGKTVIMVSHDMEMIRRADNLIVLNGGQVEASGDFHQVAAASPLFQAFLDKGGCLV